MREVEVLEVGVEKGRGVGGRGMRYGHDGVKGVGGKCMRG